MTPKEKKVLDYMNKNGGYFKEFHYSELTPVIFSKEIIEKYSHARRRKIIIETMTLSYLGKMAKKGFLRNHSMKGEFGLIKKYASKF